MSLLRDIQDAAVAGNTSVTEVLRRCKVLAARLRSSEFERWVDQELNGYESSAELPDYRVGEVESLGMLIGPMGRQAKNFPIPPSCVPKDYRDRILTTRMNQPISSYEDLLQRGDGGTFSAPWPGDLIMICADKVYSGMALVSAWQRIPRGMIVGLVDTVRNRVLSFVLEIERVAPDIVEANAAANAQQSERVHQVFQTIIYGNVANLASASAHVSQSATVIQAGDFEALSRKLEDLGLDGQSIADLKNAIEADGPHPKGMDGATSKWLGKALAKAGDGALKVSIATASNLLPRLLEQYLGLPPTTA